MVDEKIREAFYADACYRPTPEDVRCRNCGTRLKTYYAENMLYAVKCVYCEMITLVMAKNPTNAALYVGERKET